MTNETIVMNEHGEWVPGRIRPLTALQRKQLLADLSQNRVSQRSANGGGGKKMSYVEAWDVRAMLIRVFGFGGWSGEVLRAEMLDVTPNRKGNPVVSMMVTYRLTIHQLGAVYTESAVSGQAGSDFGAAAEFAVKTAESDALKRCAINLGTAFGLSLYNDGQTTDVVKQIQAPDQNGRALRRQIERERLDLISLQKMDEDAAAPAAPEDEQPAEPDKVVGTDLDFAPDPDAQPADTRPTPQRPPRGRATPDAAPAQPSDEGRAAVLDETIEGEQPPPTDQALADVQAGFGGQS